MTDPNPEDPEKPVEKEANVIYSITAKVGEHTINATMEMPDIVPYTLRPAAKTVYCYIDLSEISYEEFIKSKLYLSAVADEGKTVLWDWNYDENGKRLPNESYRAIKEGRIDCKRINEWDEYHQPSNSFVDLRIGESQLEEDEFVKYEVRFVNVPSNPFDLYAEVLFQGSKGGDWDGGGGESDTNGNITYTIQYNPAIIGNFTNEKASYIWLKTFKNDIYDYTVYEGHNASSDAPKVDNLVGKYEVAQDNGYELKGISDGKKYEFTIECTPKDEANPNNTIRKNITIVCEENIPEIEIGYRLYNQFESCTGSEFSSVTLYEGAALLEGNLYPNVHLAEDQLTLVLTYSNKGVELTNEELEKVHAVKGKFNSWEDAEAAIKADAADEKKEDKLTDIGRALLGAGYTSTFEKVNEFTLFIPEKAPSAQNAAESGDQSEKVTYAVYPVSLKLSESSPSYLSFHGINASSYYRPSRTDESGSGSGVDLILVDDADFDLTKAVVTFNPYQIEHVYVGYKDEKETGTEQISGETENDFSKGPVKYTAVARNGKVQHSWLTVARTTPTPDIVVAYNGDIDGRRISISDSSNRDHYDIFIANTGKDALKNVKVTLKDAQNVKLDDYWNVSEPATLLGFDSSSRDDYRTMDGIAKIRLLPTGKGTISGILVISADDMETKEIKLTGRSSINPSTPSTPDKPTNPNRPTGGYDYDDDDDDSSSSSGGGSGSRGSGSSSSSTGTAATVEQQQAAVTSAVQKAVQQQANSGSTQLFVRVKNVNTVTAETLKKVASEARKAGKTPVLNVDTMKGSQVDVRVSINPSLATTDLNLAGYTDSQRAASTKATFENYFSNRIIAAINLAQKDTFGQTASVCVRVPAGTDVKDLRFYSYKSNTNSYRRIQNPKAWIDQNGFIHFETEYASDIIITVGDLVLR